MTDDPKIHQLKIHYARSGFTAEEQLIRLDKDAKKLTIQIDPSTPADLYIHVPQENPPDWAEFFDGYVPRNEFGKNSSTGAALLVKMSTGIYALTFGTNGRFLLNDVAWEDRFGLKVALNCIGENTVRSIDKHSLDQILRHSSEQASRDATPGEFGFDIEQDLLKGVTGTPEQKHFGAQISGADVLSVKVPVHLNGLPELLDNLRAKFIDKTYQKKFPWVDHVAEVRNAALVEQLDQLLVAKINSNATQHIWMAVPELIKWQNVMGFRFPSRKGTFEYQDIHLDHFLSATALPITVDTLHIRAIECFGQDNHKLHRWSAYKCVYAELEHEGKVFLLSGGTWYSIKSGFIEDVNTAFENIPTYEGTFSDYHDKSEGEYLKRIVQADLTGMVLADRKLTQYGGSTIEFCDLFRNNEIFHMKRYGQSSALSHLFAQGVVSGEIFQMDATFRHEVNKLLPQNCQIANPETRPKRDEFRVIYAIISDRPGPLHLPFFSRLNLKHAAKRLEIAGFRVAKAKIPVDTVFSKAAKATRKVRKR